MACEVNGHSAAEAYFLSNNEIVRFRSLHAPATIVSDAALAKRGGFVMSGPWLLEAVPELSDSDRIAASSPTSSIR